MTPAEWLAMNAPLVDQYLQANDAWLRATIWGVSAQGGNFNEEADRAALLMQDAIDRARVYNADGESCPIEAPVVWIMDSESP